MTSTAALADEVAAFYRAPREHDPARLFDELRERAPVLRTPLGFWVVSRYEATVALLKGGRAVRTPPAASESGSPMDRLFAHFFTTVSAEDHRRMRGLVQKTFTPRAVTDLEAHVQAVADECIAGIGEAGRGDLIPDLAQALPASVFARLLGIPYEDRLLFISWINDVIDGYHPGTGEEVRERAEASAQALMDYMQEMIARRRSRPTTDLLSGLIEAHEAGDTLSADELLGASCHILLAGIETSVGMLGNAVRALLAHPEQMGRLRGDPGLASTCVEECLRWDPPVRSTPMRVALEDIELGDGVIPRGDRVTAWLGAVNRDPRRFDDPERFDVARFPNAHLSFSTGVNFCLGAHLARLEAKIALPAIAVRLPGLRLDEAGIVERDTAVVHALESLPVRC